MDALQDVGTALLCGAYVPQLVWCVMSVEAASGISSTALAVQFAGGSCLLGHACATNELRGAILGACVIMGSAALATVKYVRARTRGGTPA